MPSILEEIWPPFALHVEVGPLTLRLMRDEDLPELAEAAEAGIHADSLRPFPRDWASADATTVGRDLARRCWRYRAGLGDDEWALPLVVRHEGNIVGIQGAEARHYPALRTPDTFSWLTRSVHGRGIGTLMRRALCVLFFDELGAHQITSGAYADNPASAAVSRKVGYRPNGGKLELRDGLAAEHRRFVLDPADLVRPEQIVAISGAAGLRTVLGVGDPDE
ncbi:GNAT family N-acetyltransferase [Nocardioides acrostichi]|uniref:GNAT family N-acetyltransferase n=1 Tax=Nocardioides acrostichi TaxID=2784339 RepID=A0A930Y613_9ACTN|nr:GNAT family N-acetyltransferase [Nocardioides acrostichi]MBF4161840.1 GNAT family N-acetyltransferase [Nocardioides acrostichi]